MKIILIIFFYGLIIYPAIGYTKDISESDIDQIVSKVMILFSVPGVAVGVINNGKVIHSKGYGVRTLGSQGAIDQHTYFGIASNSKGFTSTALGILVSDGKISWDDKVKKYLPDFELSDPWITDNFTIRDLLSHSTSLPLGSGDLMWWPDANYSPTEIIAKMRYLKPDRGFRTTYAYNNLPFIIAGEIIRVVSGMIYEDFLQNRIFTPLNMDRCTANTPIMAKDTNIANPHAIIDGTLINVKRYLVIDEVAGSIAAAGIQCSIDDLLKWQMMHLNQGDDVLSKDVHDQLWQVNTPITVTEQDMKINKTHFRGYGLGFSLNDYHGVKIISHGGALIGMYSNLTMVPELGVAIAITTNQQSGEAYTIIKNQILNKIMGIDDVNTPEEILIASQTRKKAESKRLNNLKGNGSPSLSYSNYLGTYTDNWWGDTVISLVGNDLYFTSSHSASLKGLLEHFENNIFIIRWDDRTHEADAFIAFTVNEQSLVTGFKMEALSTSTDFSYDFHHVNFVKQ